MTWLGSWGTTRPGARTPSLGPGIFYHVPGRGLRSGVCRRLAQRWAEVTRCPKGIPARVMGPSLVPDTEPWRLSNRKWEEEEPGKEEGQECYPASP